MKTYRFEFKVRPSGTGGPLFDRLRYDAAFPRTEADAHRKEPYPRLVWREGMPT